MLIVRVMMVMMVMLVMLAVWILHGLASPSQMKWDGEGDRTEIGKKEYTNHEYSSGLLGEQQTEERGWYHSYYKNPIFTYLSNVNPLFLSNNNYQESYILYARTNARKKDF